MTAVCLRPLDARHDYLAKGWEVLVLPAGAKGPPPRGTTGAAGRAWSAAHLDRWAAYRPESNLGLRLPVGVIGIDVDAYNGGAETLAVLEAILGQLPASPSLSSRDDGSGIRFYRVPAGTLLHGSLGLGVDVLQHHHRYAVAGVHPSGRAYRWSGGEAPAVDELPALPEAWRRYAER